MLSDLKFARRQLLKSPGFALITILSLALGIGANTAVFSLLDAVLLERLPVRNPDGLVLFNWLAEKDAGPKSLSGWGEHDPETGQSSSTSFSIPTFTRFHEHHETLTDVFAFTPIYGGLNVNIDGHAEIVPDAQLASGDYHSALGVKAEVGRLLIPSDDQPGADPVVVISYRYWQSRFGGDPSAVGRKILIHNAPFTIVGVTAPAFRGTLEVGENVDLTVPLALYARVGAAKADEGASAGFWWIRIMGRLKPGVSRDQARAQLAGIFQQSIKGAINQPALPAGQPLNAAPDYVHLQAEPGAQGLNEARRDYQHSLGLLSGLVGLVLLIACTNITNLLLARGAVRRREIALRLALGASRTRIIRQLMLESFLLSALGAAAGLLFALWGRDALMALHPLGGDNLTVEPHLNLGVLAFTSVVAVLTSVMFGLAPALRATRVNLSAEFQGGTQTLGLGSRSRLARMLMVVQVALSLVLLVSAGLSVRTLRNLEHADVGFSRDHLLLFHVDAPANGADATKSAAIYDRLAERFSAIPGVSKASFSMVPLLSGGSWSSSVNVRAANGAPHNEPTRVNRIGPDFLATIQLPVLAGRAFSAHDDEHAPKVAIINQTLARNCFGTENPIGRQVGFGDTIPNIEVVGVVRDAQYYNVLNPPPPTIYLPFRQRSDAVSVSFVLRFKADPTTILPALQAAAHEVDPNLPLANIRTQDEQLEKLFGQQRLFASLCSFFGLLALGLAAVGLYGLMSYVVVRRTGEIGLRMALGALPTQVQAMIVRESLLLVTVGVFVGTGIALGTTRLVANMLFGLTASDPLTYAVAAMLLGSVAFVATFLPARRAAQTDPMVALRSE
jgi:predicted permease